MTYLDDLTTHETQRLIAAAVTKAAKRCGFPAIDAIGRDELESEALVYLVELFQPDAGRRTTCHHCGGDLPAGRRIGSKYCSTKCRKTVAQARFRGKEVELAPTEDASRIGLAERQGWKLEDCPAFAVARIGLDLANYVATRRQDVPMSLESLDTVAHSQSNRRTTSSDDAV